MKKGLALTFSIFLLAIFLISFVSAEDVSAEGSAAAEKATSWVAGFLGSTIGTIGTSLGTSLTSVMASKILLWILLYLLIWDILLVFNFNSILKYVIPFIITAIAMLALPEGFIGAISVSYGAMGAAILSVIPFIILFIFSARVESRLVARIAWLFFAAYFFGLAIYGWATNTGFAGRIAYIIAGIAGFIVFFFIGTIRNFMFSEQLADSEEAGDKIVEEAKLIYKQRRKEVGALS